MVVGVNNQVACTRAWDTGLARRWWDHVDASTATASLAREDASGRSAFCPCQDALRYMLRSLVARLPTIAHVSVLSFCLVNTSRTVGCNPFSSLLFVVVSDIHFSTMAPVMGNGEHLQRLLFSFSFPRVRRDNVILIIIPIDNIYNIIQYNIYDTWYV